MEDVGPSMDQELAKKLFFEGGTLVILNLPAESEFGIDLKSWRTGSKFKGVKMIPPGLHMYHYNISNIYGEVAPRVSFIHNFKRSEIVVKKWNADLEEIVSDDISEEEISRLKSNLQSLDLFLGPYPYDIWDKWKCLIKNVTEKLVSRITPECGVIRSALDLVNSEPTCHNLPGTSKLSEDQRKDSSESSTESCKMNNDETIIEPKVVGDKINVRRQRRKDIEADLLPNLKPAPGTELRFTEVPDDLFPNGSTPSDITRHSIDPTFTLDTLLSSMENEKEYVGEVELSFACFLVGLSLDSLEAWKRFVILACRCQSAVMQRPTFYTSLLNTLHTQLQHIPEDFLVDIVESENAVYMSLRDIFRTTLTSEGVDRRLKKIAQNFSQKLSEKFGWDFTNLEEDDEDDAPVIVDLG